MRQLIDGWRKLKIWEKKIITYVIWMSYEYPFHVLESKKTFYFNFMTHACLYKELFFVVDWSKEIGRDVLMAFIKQYPLNTIKETLGRRLERDFCDCEKKRANATEEKFHDRNVRFEWKKEDFFEENKKMRWN